MGRPSKLSDRQWAEIGRRLAAGEGVRALAKEFRVSHGTISERFSDRVPRLRELATTLATTEAEVERLPVSEQATVRTLADQIRGISESLVKVAALGGKTGEILAGHANRKAARLGDDPDPEELKMVVGLTEGANRAVVPAVALINSGKEKAEDLRQNMDLSARLAEAEKRARLSNATTQPTVTKHAALERQEMKARLLEARQKLTNSEESGRKA
jgi:hypothetical protein